MTTDREKLLSFRQETALMLNRVREIERNTRENRGAASDEFLDATVRLRERLEEMIAFTDYQLSGEGE